MNHWCDLHKIAFDRHEKDGNVWYSHKTGNVWCNEPKEVKQAPVTPVKQTETREPVPQEIPFKIRDYEAENRGKCRHGLLVARTQLVGLVPITQDEFDALNQLVEISMTGKIPESPEDVDDIELPSETVKGG